ncbi:MAG TPA: hypothetical protein VIS48_05920 [Candidatus Kryptonia bacterium]
MIRRIFVFASLLVILTLCISCQQTAYGQIRTPEKYSLLTAGSDQEITWNTQGDSASIILLQFSTDGGANWDYIGTSGVLAGTYNWVIPVTINSWDCMIRMEQYNGSRYETIASTGIFSINALDPSAYAQGVFSHHPIIHRSDIVRSHTPNGWGRK